MHYFLPLVSAALQRRSGLDWLTPSRAILTEAA